MTNMSWEDLDKINMWTPESARDLVDQALDEKNAEARQFLALLRERSFIPVIHLVQRFLGHQADVLKVNVLKDCSDVALFSGCDSRAPFPGPAYSSQELFKRALTEYLWKWIPFWPKNDFGRKVHFGAQD